MLSTFSLSVIKVKENDSLWTVTVSSYETIVCIQIWLSWNFSLKGSYLSSQSSWKQTKADSALWIYFKAVVIQIELSEICAEY